MRKYFLKCCHCEETESIIAGDPETARSYFELLAFEATEDNAVWCSDCIFREISQEDYQSFRALEVEDIKSEEIKGRVRPMAERLSAEDLIDRLDRMIIPVNEDGQFVCNPRDLSAMKTMIALWRADRAAVEALAGETDALQMVSR